MGWFGRRFEFPLRQSVSGEELVHISGRVYGARYDDNDYYLPSDSEFLGNIFDHCWLQARRQGLMYSKQFDCDNFADYIKDQAQIYYAQHCTSDHPEGIAIATFIYQPDGQNNLHKINMVVNNFKQVRYFEPQDVIGTSLVNSPTLTSFSQAGGKMFMINDAYFANLSVTEMNTITDVRF